MKLLGVTGSSFSSCSVLIALPEVVRARKKVFRQAVSSDAGDNNFSTAQTLFDFKTSASTGPKVPEDHFASLIKEVKLKVAKGTAEGVVRALVSEARPEELEKANYNDSISSSSVGLTEEELRARKNTVRLETTETFREEKKEKKAPDANVAAAAAAKKADVDTSGNWTLFFRQSAGTFKDPAEWLKSHGQPTDPNFSILDTLGDQHKGADGKFHFKMVWPERQGPNSQEWKQSSNPSKKEKLAGYEPVNVQFTQNNWRGLEYNGFATLFDGSVGSGKWFYAIGSKIPWQNGMPGPEMKPERQTELHVFTGPSQADLAKKKAEEEAKKKAEEETKKKAEEESKKKADEARAKEADIAAKKKAEEEAAKKTPAPTPAPTPSPQEIAKNKADEEAKKKADEEAKKKADEEAKKKADEEAKKKADEEAKTKAEEEAKKKHDAVNAPIQEAKKVVTNLLKKAVEAIQVQRGEPKTPVEVDLHGKSEIWDPVVTALRKELFQPGMTHTSGGSSSSPTTTPEGKVSDISTGASGDPNSTLKREIMEGVQKLIAPLLPALRGDRSRGKESWPWGPNVLSFTPTGGAVIKDPHSHAVLVKEAAANGFNDKPRAVGEPAHKTLRLPAGTELPAPDGVGTFKLPVAVEVDLKLNGYGKNSSSSDNSGLAAGTSSGPQPLFGFPGLREKLEIALRGVNANNSEKSTGGDKEQLLKEQLLAALRKLLGKSNEDAEKQRKMLAEVAEVLQRVKKTEEELRRARDERGTAPLQLSMVRKAIKSDLNSSDDKIREAEDELAKELARARDGNLVRCPPGGDCNVEQLVVGKESDGSGRNSGRRPEGGSAPSVDALLAEILASLTGGGPFAEKTEPPPGTTVVTVNPSTSSGASFGMGDNNPKPIFAGESGSSSTTTSPQIFFPVTTTETTPGSGGDTKPIFAVEGGSSSSSSPPLPSSAATDSAPTNAGGGGGPKPIFAADSSSSSTADNFESMSNMKSGGGFSETGNNNGPDTAFQSEHGRLMKDAISQVRASRENSQFPSSSTGSSSGSVFSSSQSSSGNGRNGGNAFFPNSNNKDSAGAATAGGGGTPKTSTNSGAGAQSIMTFNRSALALPQESYYDE